MTNSFLLFRAATSNSSLDRLGFRREVVRFLMAHNNRMGGTLKRHPVIAHHRLDLLGKGEDARFPLVQENVLMVEALRYFTNASFISFLAILNATTITSFDTENCSEKQKTCFLRKLSCTKCSTFVYDAFHLIQ